MAVIDLHQRKRKRQRSPRDLVAIDKTSGAGRFYFKMQHEIQKDLGGSERLSRIELELINAFCGASTQLRYLNHQILFGEGSEIDLAGFSQLASTIRARSCADADGVSWPSPRCGVRR
jgi:hypothetical protein